MRNAPFPNLMQGIHLVQGGRKAEALPYLRHAVRTEPVTAEGWLWLAAATPDRDEYRHCVWQALQLEPYHPVATQMHAELERQTHWSAAPPGSGVGYPPVMAGYQPGAAGYPPVMAGHPPVMAGAMQRQDTAAYDRPSRWRRALRALVIALLMGGCLGVVGALFTTGVALDFARGMLRIEDTHALQFTVTELPGFRFRVELPVSWVAADEDNPSWRTTREALMAELPASDGEESVWEAVSASFSTTVRDPVYGDMLPAVRLVETDAELVADHGMVAALTLHAIVPYPASASGQDTCGQMRALEADLRDHGGLESAPNRTLVDERVIQRSEHDDCAWIVHWRLTNQASHQVPFPLSMARAPSAIREVRIAVPVGAEHYAMWHLTFADPAFEDYDYTIDLIGESLLYRPS
jgi:hypothetical protein